MDEGNGREGNAARGVISRRELLRRGVLGAAAAVPLIRSLGSSPGFVRRHSSAPVRGGTLNFGRETGPTQLDPANSIVGGDVYTLDKIFEPLYITSVAGQLVPWLASGHTVSSDGKNWTFHVRPGVKFSDGKPLVAEDVVFSITRAAHDQNGPLSFLDSALKDLSAKGNSKVVAQLHEAWAPFLSDISVFANAIVPANFGGATAKSFFTHPVGTGPFELKSMTKGAGATLIRNPHYWQPGKPYLDEVVFSYIPDDNSRVLQLKSGEVSVISAVPPAQVSSLKADSSVVVGLFPAWSVDLLFFNEKLPQFKDRHVRRAIAHALNIPAIARATTFGTAKAGGSFMPPSLQFYADVPTLSYSLASAKSELAKSGYPRGFSTSLLIDSGDQAWVEAAQIIQQQLAPLHIRVSVRPLDNAAYTAAFEAFNYDMMINNAINDISDADEMASFNIDFVSGGSKSFWTYYDNPTAIALVHRAEAELSGSKRAALYRQIQELIAQDAPFIALDYPPNIYAWSPRVHNFAVNPGGAYRLEDVWLD